MTTRLPSLLASDVFARPGLWEAIPRNRACLLAAFSPVVVVHGTHTTSKTASWFKPELATSPYRSMQAYAMDGLSYYRFKGGATSQGSSRSRGAAMKRDVMEPTGPVEAAQKVCQVTAIEYSSGKRKPVADVLHVVAKDGAKISLKADMKGGCGQHPSWEIVKHRTQGGTEKKTLTGQSATLPLDSWDYKKLTLWKAQPETVEIALHACDGATKYGKVMVWPRDEIEMRFSRSPSERGGIWKYIGEWKAEIQVKPNGHGMDLQTRTNDKYAKDKQALVSTLERIGRALGLPIPASGGGSSSSGNNTLKWENQRETEHEVLKRKVKLDHESEIEVLNPFNFEFKGNWEDNSTNNTVFFQYELNANVTLFSGSYQIEFGPLAAIPPKIKKWTTDYLGDIKLYVRFSGEITVGGTAKRKLPGKVEGGLHRRGELGVKLGANIFLLKKSVVNFDVNGQTKVTAEVKDNLIATPPHTAIELSWEGVKGEFTIEAAFGLVCYHYQHTFIDGGKIWDWSYPPTAD